MAAGLDGGWIGCGRPAHFVATPGCDQPNPRGLAAPNSPGAAGRRLATPGWFGAWLDFWQSDRAASGWRGGFGGMVYRPGGGWGHAGSDLHHPGGPDRPGHQAGDRCGIWPAHRGRHGPGAGSLGNGGASQPEADRLGGGRPLAAGGGSALSRPDPDQYRP
ncbi:MAG: hypothetical protein DWH82_11230 [Planctomycetota bacterium]|nr:MAG: hypothetical protein DWH82_11230 [Planctomycetota bacterium]